MLILYYFIKSNIFHILEYYFKNSTIIAESKEC